MLVHDESAAVHLLQRQAIKPTAQRVEIALLLLQEHQHLSAEQVLERLRRRGKAVSKATVYNTLGFSRRAGSSSRSSSIRNGCFMIRILAITFISTT